MSVRHATYTYDRSAEFARFVTVLWTSAAFLAGLNGMRRSRFIIANAAGGLLWSAGWATAAYFLGTVAAHAGSVIAIVGLVATAGGRQQSAAQPVGRGCDRRGRAPAGFGADKGGDHRALLRGPRRVPDA